MQTGQVVWFNDSKGFGLIETENGQTVFVHYTSIQFSSTFHQDEFRKLSAGQLVEFDLYEDAAKGYFARNVIAVGNA
jgi:CspA family cold shock protein